MCPRKTSKISYVLCIHKMIPGEHFLKVGIQDFTLGTQNASLIAFCVATPGRYGSQNVTRGAICDGRYKLLPW